MTVSDGTHGSHWEEFLVVSRIRRQHASLYIGDTHVPSEQPHLRLERDRGLVEAKKRAVFDANGNLACEVCRFDFQKCYGSLGEGFCEVHHRKILSKTVGERVTNLDELAVVCSNCHRMLHRSGRLISIEKLRLILSSV